MPKAYHFDTENKKNWTVVLSEGNVGTSAIEVFGNSDKKFILKSMLPIKMNKLCGIFVEVAPSGQSGVIFCINDEHEPIMGDVYVVGMEYDPTSLDEKRRYKLVDVGLSTEECLTIFRFIDDPSYLFQQS